MKLRATQPQPVHWRLEARPKRPATTSGPLIPSLSRDGLTTSGSRPRLENVLSPLRGWN